jgi:hypothetical protein
MIVIPLSNSDLGIIRPVVNGGMQMAADLAVADPVGADPGKQQRSRLSFAG